MTRKKKQQKGKTIALNICVSALIFLLLFIFLEGILSLLGIGDISKQEGWGYSHKCCGDFRHGEEFIAQVVPEHPYFVKINNLGFRDDTDTTEEPTGQRILAVGDSFTFGVYLSNNETWPAQLESRFDGVEVLNAGHFGYSIDDEYAYMKEKGIRMKPDLVVLQFLPNDITDMDPSMESYRGYRYSGPAFYAIMNLFRDHSRLFATAMEIVFAKRGEETATDRDAELERVFAIQYGSGHEFNRAYASWFDRFVNLTRKEGIGLLVVAYPTVQQIKDPTLDAPNKFLENLCDEHDVPYLDLMPAFLDDDRADLLFLLPWNEHPSAYGNRIAAEAIAREIEARGLLEAPQ